MRLLVLTFLLTVAFGDMYETCISFEADDRPRGIYIENPHENDTSILVYNREDIGKTNIPDWVYTAGPLLESEESFGLCSELNVTEGVCDGPAGTFNVKVTGDGTPHDWLNVVLRQGEGVKYDINEEGNYCVVAYRNSDMFYDEIVVKEVHGHGFLSRRDYRVFQVYQLQLVLLIATAVAMYLTFQKNKKSYLGDIFQDFVTLMVLQFAEVIVFNVKFMIMNTNVNFSNSNKTFDIDHWLPKIFEKLDLLVLYKLSRGVYGYGKLSRQQLSIQPIFVLCMVSFAVSETAFAFHGLVYTKLSKVFANIMMSLLGVMRYSLWVPTLFLIFENSDITFKGIFNPVHANKYFLTRRVLFLVPLALEFISRLGSNVVGNIMRGDEHFQRGDFRAHQFAWDDIRSTFLVTMLDHMEDFAQVAVQWLLLYIWVWKPTKIDLAEQEASTAVELDDMMIGAGNSKLA
ncbi:uncharacterized protein CYBJADRAFT_174246 [Cyberlindnera jadinii NRRL Y-1542]|uniref:Uncharacterized protein n=1 Tax=Cyberlindnera jadinii (strain ATCC 18201 / CBS 1600 / BCRC 20928 / JCM 3617 / NBRC 0987 / NRRL Y-1542) TaxID=983966 RepID=A0A1E4RZ46_CYBJN|nr:hypothetical protein CYBJADRAFT_174246 [Cyberlindnera jadinii NRRL Y-1542]ODV72385.1 hypothetical protein CYBJADRAFT_174246 [Cyberlindnera jadinii NRRL Y-1542]